MSRRILLLLALMAALVGSARAEALCVVTEAGARLVDDAGNTIIDGVDDVFVVRKGALYAAGERGAYRLCGEKGEALGETAFAMIYDAGDCLIYRVGSRYGAMDAAGNILLDAAWTQLVSDGAGGWLALDTDPLDESPDAILHILPNGEAVPAGATASSGLSPIADDRMPVMVPDGRFGAIDAAGAVVIEPTWRYIGPFDGGLAKAVGEAGAGLIDVDGIAVIPPIYVWLERGPACVAAQDETGVDVYSPDGERLVFSIPGESLEASLAGDDIAVWDGATTGLYGADGTLVAETAGRIEYAPGTNGQLIASDGAWGERCAWLLNPDGSAASERYQRLLPLCPGRYAYLEMEGIEYYSADLGRLQTSWNYESLRYGLLDGEGKALLPAEYLEIRALSDDRLLLVSEAGAFLADKDGNVLVSWLNPQTGAPTDAAADAPTG